MTTTFTRVSRSLIAAASVAACAASTLADDIFRTENPEGGFFGYIGFDVFPGQSVAARFIPSGAYTLDHVRVWFMSNDFEGGTPQTVRLSLRTDVNPGTEFDSVPSETILESWTQNITAIGWNPVLEDFASLTHTAINAGQKYWIVAESDVPAQFNPVWNWSAFGNEFTATTDGAGTPWEGGFGAAIALVVEGTPVGGGCIGDFNGSGGQPTVQDIFDFLAAYFGNDPASDVNDSDSVTVQDIFDFLAAYFTGCP
ncbi:MAG: hypothetical protein IT438_07370 [Phycisphaerales bacterium]|nr:hypothetical protein [Phycisphaerales bacterium]